MSELEPASGPTLKLRGARHHGALPKVATESQSTSWSDVARSWVIFIGLALAFGRLLNELFVWRRGASTVGANARRRRPSLVARSLFVEQP